MDYVGNLSIKMFSNSRKLKCRIEMISLRCKLNRYAFFSRKDCPISWKQNRSKTMVSFIWSLVNWLRNSFYFGKNVINGGGIKELRGYIDFVHGVDVNELQVI